MTFITHRFRVSVVSDVWERVQDFMITFALYVKKIFVSVLHGTCLQCVKIFFSHQYVQPCLSKNPKYTFYTIKSSLTLAYQDLYNIRVSDATHTNVTDKRIELVIILDEVRIPPSKFGKVCLKQCPGRFKLSMWFSFHAHPQ